MQDQAMFTLMWIPANGLFRNGAYFTDGEGRRIGWDGTIKLFKLYKSALKAKNEVLAQHPIARGEVVILQVSLHEQEK
jgi:hypothetical protein